jgi:carbon-monoxide dehydrogenase large subunit
MAKFGVAQGRGRLEDQRFLTGAGRYVDDIAPKDSLVAYFLRAPMAHGRIAALDLTAARAAAGVHLVLDAAGLAALGVDLAMEAELVAGRSGAGAGPERPVLARGVVRFAGEAVAVVVAETLAQARDAAELIGLEVEDLAVHTAVAVGGAAIHPEAPDNLAFDYSVGDEAGTAAALAASAHRIALEVVHNRIIVASIEPRAAYAEWAEGRLHLCVNGQGVWIQKRELARMLGLDRGAVRVTNPDVGGGFGMKSMTYPEYVVIAAAARALARPVRWIADRSEAMLTDNAGRDLIARAEIGFDADLNITAYGVNLVSNLGAYNSQYGQAIQSELFAKVLTGVYDIPVAHLGALGVFTNTTPVDAYRGAGRPEANLTIERVMDHAARVLGVDGFDLRARNVIKTFPYPMISGEAVDCGDFARVLAVAKDRADVAGFAARKSASQAAGRLRGLGVASYLEAILGSPVETSRIVLDADGGLTMYVGTQSNGQGHETVYTRMLAEATGVDPALIRIVQGDSDRIRHGGGTGGSRSVTVQGTATKATVAAVVDGLAVFLAAELGVRDVTFAEHIFAAPGSNMRLTLAEAAELARQNGKSDLLDVSQTIELAAGAYPNGCHVVEVEVDPDTGGLVVERYTVVDDFGTQMAPELVAGQVQGGIAQGFGQAVTENAVYDGDGQLLSGSFMDYAMPRASDLPFISLHDAPTYTKTNPLGMKGCGEAGTVGACGAISNAVLDALAPRGVTHVDMPLSPSRIWAWLKEADAVAD